jgi:hypothetical protein
LFAQSEETAKVGVGGLVQSLLLVHVKASMRIAGEGFNVGFFAANNFLWDGQTQPQPRHGIKL